jgi:hypothetical protein
MEGTPMKSNSTWLRVSKHRPCPMCGKPDWCLFTGEPSNPTAVICARTESPKRCGEGGWLHVLRDDGPTWQPWRRSIHLAIRMMHEPSNGKPDMAKLAADYRAAVRPEALTRLAVALGVSAESLRRLGVGWAPKNRDWSFPMSNAAGEVLGIRLRLPSGHKLSVKGGKEGLFIPVGIDAHGLLLVCEGPTDAAALLDLGFSAVGRPSCTGGIKLLVDLLRKLKPSGVVIVADGDAPGQRGAEVLTVKLMAYCPMVRIITPPAGVKDAREWKRGGATSADVAAAIDAAPVRKLRVSVHRKAGHDARRK